MLAKATKDSLAPTVALIRDRHEPFQPSAQGRATGNTGVSKTSESIPLGITEAPKLAKGSGGISRWGSSVADAACADQFVTVSVGFACLSGKLFMTCLTCPYRRSWLAVELGAPVCLGSRLRTA